jgi:SagB-type dehydrogenase family enzyme
MSQPGHPLPPPPQWSKPILDRILRVFEYHQTSKLAPRRLGSAGEPEPSDPPSLFRTFEGAEKIALPVNLMNAEAPTVSLLVDGLRALPESQLNPPLNLRTLASWLYFGDGLLRQHHQGGRTTWLRTLPSNGDTYPCEIWVAAFGIEGLEPGLYYYSPREFALRKVREGLGVLAHLKRGRPDLDFLREIPATLLISTVLSRATCRFHKRGYRTALLDAGHLVENLVHAGNALGMQTAARLRINDFVGRELIGVPVDVPFEHAEFVQGMVSWTNALPEPLVVPGGWTVPLPPIFRATHGQNVVPYDTIVAAHEDCVAPGVVIRDVRPPLTQLSPIDGVIPATERVPITPPAGGRPLGQLIMKRQPLTGFARKSIPRDPFLAINKLAMRKLTYYPLVPEAPHVALVRPLWFIHDVSGFESGVWYYHPQTDRWSMLARGSFRAEARYLSGEQELAGDASAVCVFIANIHLLLQQAGPDTYRLAHLEAGAVAHRMILLAEAQNLAAAAHAGFFDDELRRFFGLDRSGWEVLYQVFVGEEFNEQTPGLRLLELDESTPADVGLWRD